MIIYGIEESCSEVLIDRVKVVVEGIDEKPVVKDSVRVGVKGLKIRFSALSSSLWATVIMLPKS